MEDVKKPDLPSKAVPKSRREEGSIEPAVPNYSPSSAHPAAPARLGAVARSQPHSVLHSPSPLGSESSSLRGNVRIHIPAQPPGSIVVPPDPVPLPPLTFLPLFNIPKIPRELPLSECGEWEVDASVAKCPICPNVFGFFTRKHHCRKCGRIVCDSCSLHTMTVTWEDNVSTGRACTNCFISETGPHVTVSTPRFRPSPTPSLDDPVTVPPSPNTVPVSDRVLPPVVRLDGDAFTYISRPTLVGSTPSCGIFEREGKRYFGKAEVVHDANIGLRSALSEMCSNDIYAFFGCNAQKMCLSEQNWLPGSGILADDVQIPKGIHLMCEWIEGIQMFEDGWEACLHRGGLKWPTVRLPDGAELDVKGLGEVLAVALLLNDIDCLGGSLKNVGYIVAADVILKRRVAQVVKIDPGFAFHQCDRQHSVPPLVHAEDVVASFREVAAKHIRYAPSLPPLSFNRLPSEARCEFLETLRDMFQLDRPTMLRWFKRPGFEALYPDDLGVGVRLQFLEDRLAAIREAYVSLLPPLTGARPLMNTPEACLEGMKARYSAAAQLRDPITGESHPLSEHAVHLLLLRTADDTDVDEAMAPLHQQVSVTTGVPARKRDIELDELVPRCKGATKRINMSGGAGYGKSTCCQVMMSQWAVGKLFTEFTLVLWVPLRRLTAVRYPKQSYDIVDVILCECLDVEPTPRLKQLVLQLYNPSSTLWILDGYDEIVGREPPQVKEALGEMLTAPNRILTGRPQAMSAVPSDFQVEVAGFNDRDVLDFVNRFTGTEVHAPQVRSHSQNSIVSKLRNNRVLWQLAHVPVNLILLCHVLKDSFYVANMSLTGVYTRIEWLMMLRSQDRELAAVEDSGADVTPMLPMMRVLSDVAMEAAMAGVVVIPGSAVEKCFSEREGVGWPQLLACGMLTQADVSSLTPDVAQFFFLHLTLQEYYAAKGVIGACMHQNVTVLDWLRRNKYASHLEMVWVFAAGLLSQLCSDSNAALEALNVFAQLWLDPPRDIGKQQETRLWMRMCEEGRLWQFTDASPSVLTLITQLDSRVRIACVSMLSGASPSTRFGWFGTFRDCPMYLNRCVSVMEDLPSLLCSAMTHDAPDVRRVSIQLVGWLGLEVLQLREIVTALLRTIDSDNHQLRLVGIQCLLGFGSAAVLRDPVLVEWIRAHFASDRRDVAQAIADLVLGLNEDVFDLDSDWIIQCVMSELENARLHSLAVSVLKGLHHCLYTFEPVTTWLRSCFELDDHRHFDTACDILVAMGPTLIHVPWASNWVLQSLPTHSEPHIRVLASIGVQCLHSVEFDWVRPWLKQVMASGDVREWKLAMPVIITVSSSLLQFDWFVQWLLRALSTLETSSEVVAVVQSLGHLVIQHQSIVTSLFSLLKHSSRIAAPTLHTLSDLGVDVVALGFSPLVLLSLVRATDTRLEALKVASLVDCRRWKGVDLRPTVMTCLDRLNEPPILSATFHWLSVLRWEDTAQPLILELLTDITTSLGDSSSALILSLLSSFGSRLAASEEFVVLLQRFLSSKDADVARAAALCVVRMDGTAMKYDALVSWMERLVSGARPDVSSCCFVIQLLRMYGLASIQQRPRLCALLFALLQDDRKETVLSLLNDLFPHVSLSNDELLNWFLRHVVSADVAIRTAAYNSLRSMVLLHNHSLPEQALPPAALAFLAHSNAISLDIHREWGSVLQLDSTAGRCTLTVSEEAFAVLRDLDFDSIQLPAVDLSPVEACCASITSLLDIGDESTAVIADALRRFQWEDRVHVTAWQHVKELCSRMVPRLDVVDKLLDLVLDSMRSLVTNVVVQTACCELLLGIPTLKPRWPLRQALQEQLLIALQEHVGDERLRKPALSLLVRAGQDLNKLASDAGILLVIQAVDALCSEAPPAFLTERVALKGGISLVLEAISTASDDLCCLEACVHILYMFTTVPSTTQPGTAPGDVSVSLLENPQFWTALATARDKLPPGHKDQLRITATIRNALHPIAPVSSLAEAEAIESCQAVTALFDNRVVPSREAISRMLIASLPSLGRPSVTQGFLSATAKICSGGNDANRRLCGELGIVDACVAMLDMCGPGDEITAATGADALDALVQGSPTNGQTAALAGAMAALLHSMGAHPLSYDVQHRCCLALKDICTVSLLALTNLRTAASEARPLLSAVKVNHPRGGGGYAKDFAEDLWAKMQQ